LVAFLFEPVKRKQDVVPRRSQQDLNGHLS
jgi:hypothetical protein